MKTENGFEVKDRLNVSPTTGDIPSPVNGDIWYNSVTGKFRKKENNIVTDLDQSDDNVLYAMMF